jgi:NAD(P)-dependent dehydrogenase (short-subunit alcohol dehydrogenase family)
MKMNQSVAIVTGASQGIGRSTSIRLARAFSAIVFAHELEHTGGHSPEDAKAVASKLLPDILSYNSREPVRYPNNGRTLTDDVVDFFFSIYANRNVTDKVGPHGDLLDEFPYLGTAALGYKKSNKSPILKLLLSRLDELVARVSKREKA